MNDQDRLAPWRTEAAIDALHITRLHCACLVQRKLGLNSRPQSRPATMPMPVIHSGTNL